MSNLDELSMLWQVKVYDIPAEEDIKAYIRQFKTARRRKKSITVAVALALAVLLCFSLAMAGFKQWTSFTGGGFILGACLFLAISNLRSMQKYKIREQWNSKDFLAAMEQSQTNMMKYYLQTQKLMFTVLGAGLSLMMLEPMGKNLIAGICLYAGSIAGLMVCWYYLRPKYFKRNLARIEAERTHLLMLVNQYENSQPASNSY